MTTLTLDPRVNRTPTWILGFGALGVLWNLFGVYQFLSGFTPSGQAAMTAGMTPSQAQMYLSLPPWISVVFALGVFGGLIGSIMLLMRWHWALPVLGASLAGYLLLFAGDLYYGVFDALPGQLAVLGFVVLIAAVLLCVAWIACRRSPDR